MGGNVFITSTPHGPALAVPRMSPDLYQRLRDQYQPKLMTLFSRVLVPAEAPGKADYGDIDFLVSKQEEKEFMDWEKVAEVLGAVRVKAETQEARNFAVAWPVVSCACV